MRADEVPGELVERAALVWHSDECPDDGCEGGDLNEYDRRVRNVLAAVLPEYGATVLEDARRLIRAAYKTGPGNNFQGKPETWRKGMARAHRIVRDFQRSLRGTTTEGSGA